MANSPLLWNRLEMRTRNEAFDENLCNTIHDPYWTLCRQWQTGEFEASDNGSPAEARVKWRDYPINTLSLAGNDALPLSDRQPLEAEIERLIVKPGIPLRIEMGRHLQRLLEAELGDAAGTVIDSLKAVPELQFSLTENSDPDAQQANAHLLCNRSLQSWLHAAVQTRALDGGALYAALKGGQTISSFLTTADATADEVGNKWLNWFDQQYNQPDNEEVDGWLPSRMEYQFSNSVQAKEEVNVKIGAEEYYEGRLDWYTFSYHEDNADPGPAGTEKEPQIRHLIPNQVEYPGMPAARWWEMEDAKVNLLAIETSTTQSGRLALMEFGLMYSNDWFILPLRVPVGGLLEIEEIEVRSVFGEWSNLGHYKTSANNGEWTFFGLGGPTGSSVDEQYLLISPSVIDLKESRAQEEVYLARDEMANMVWAIEHQIPNGIDGTREGNVASLDVATFLQNLSGEVTNGAAPPPPLQNEAKVNYTLATSVPENWIPFIPVQMEPDSNNNAIWLQRGAMPRVYPGLNIERIRPRTSLIRQGLDQSPRQPYFVFEEEVPRSGIRVSRTWQRARWYQGRVSLWSGYRKQNGRGQGNSGLRFDILEERK